MAESWYSRVRQSTAHRELIIYVIEDPTVVSTTRGVRIEPALTLREIERSLAERSVIVWANDRRKV